MRRFLAIWAALLLCHGAFAQGSIQQSGGITPFHGGAWYANGIMGDAGTQGSPFLSTLALYNGANCPFSISSQPNPGVYLSPYSQMSVCVTSTTTTLYFQGFLGQGNPSVFFNIGGVNYPFPGGYGNVQGPNSSVNGDVACFSGTSGSLLEDCGSSSAIASSAILLAPLVSNLPTCNSGVEGISRGVTDLSNPSFMSPAVGGGTVHGRVYCAGTGGWITE